MKKRLIFTLVLCFLVLFSNNVFATQETNNNDVTPAHVVDLVYYSHIYQMFGNVGGHGYIGATQAIEMLKTDSYLYEDNIVKSVDVQVGYNVQSIVAAPTAIPYNSGKMYHIASTHYANHDGQTVIYMSYKYL